MQPCYRALRSKCTGKNVVLIEIINQIVEAFERFDTCMAEAKKTAPVPLYRAGAGTCGCGEGGRRGDQPCCGG